MKSRKNSALAKIDRLDMQTDRRTSAKPAQARTADCSKDPFNRQ
jgi:hypothetical protein